MVFKGSLPGGKMKTYICKLKSRKEIEADIPRGKWGWWHDVCPGETLELRTATEEDLKRCCGTKDKNPNDYLCEVIKNYDSGEIELDSGSLILKEAIKHILMPIEDLKL